MDECVGYNSGCGVHGRQSSELNQLRSEYSGLMKELTENNNKLQQEEHQRKSLEVNYKQNVSQLEVCGLSGEGPMTHTGI
jgi:hypothetical protein